MPISTRAVSSSIAAGALTLVSLSSCGDGAVYVRVNVNGIPTGTKTISIKSFVDSTAYGEQLFDVSSTDKTLVAGMLLPTATRGTFKADISPLDASGKALQTCGVDYAGSSSRDILTDRDTTVDVSLGPNYPDSGISGNLYGVWGSAPNDVWVIGDHGLTARWNGCYWRRVESGVTVALRGILGLASDNIWVVGGDTASDANAMVIHWDGVSWTPQQPAKNGAIQGMFTGIWGTSSTNMYAIGTGPAGPLIAIGAGGTDWTTYVDLFLVDKPSVYNAIHGIDQTHIYIVGKAANNKCTAGYSPPCTGQVTTYYSAMKQWIHLQGDSQLIGELTAIYAESASKIWFGGAGGFVAGWSGSTVGTNPPTGLNGITVATSSLPTTMANTGVKWLRTFTSAAMPGPFVTVQAANNTSDFYRLDSGTPTRLTATPSQLDHPVLSFWGPSPGDTWLVGNDSVRYHYDGTAFKKYIAPL